MSDDHKEAMDFPPSEFEHRCERVQAELSKAGIDALLLSTEAEIRYFTGFRTLFWQSPTRPWFLVIPQKGKPKAIIPEIGADLMRSTWIEDIETWSSPAPLDDGISLLSHALSAFPILGMPMGRESTLRMPLLDFAQLRHKLHGHEWKNATPIIDAVRQIKSEAEIEILKEIGQIASVSFSQAPALFHIGMPMDDIFRKFKISLLENGAEDVPYLVGGLDEGGYMDVISPPTKRQARAGDLLMLDTGATLKGYFCDFDRNFAFGHASDDAKYGYDKLFKTTEATINMMRPGVSCAEIYRFMSDQLEANNSNVGRYGHGLGIQLTETPSIINFDHTLLKSGMTMTIEPSLNLKNGKMMVHEENILITEDEPILLSQRAAPELMIIE